MKDPHLQAEIDAYWARPYGVRIRTRYYSVTHMFTDEAKAVSYIADQSALAIRERSYMDFHAELFTPAAKTRRYWDWRDIR